jgi:hypothetical protein
MPEISAAAQVGLHHDARRDFAKLAITQNVTVPSASIRFMKLHKGHTMWVTVTDLRLYFRFCFH